jgi:tRNA (mo5U34)-methyltransferase
MSAEPVSASLLAEQHATRTRVFLERARQLGYMDLSSYYWFHTIDLGNGLVTPGTYDYRDALDSFAFPVDMHGAKVLDIGSATGFFSFEFEKRGAQVTSVELPSLSDIDCFPGETNYHTIRKLANMMPSHSSYSHDQVDSLFQAPRLRELYDSFLEGPFQFCRQVLKSQVQRCYSTIYDLSPEKTGEKYFDYVFVGDVLIHTIYPLKALASAAALCRGTLILAQILPEPDLELPVMVYVGGDRPGEDDVSWWVPNYSCFNLMLKKLGFSSIKLVGYNEGRLLPGGGHYKRAIIHASRG